MHDRLKVLLFVNEVIVSDPEVGLLPLQPPEAVHLCVSVLLQFNVVEPFIERFVGLAERLTIGAEGVFITTFTKVSALPLSPVHERIKVLSFIMELMVSVPEGSLLPDQSPEAVQLVTSVLLQLRVVEPLSLMISGEAVNEIEGVRVSLQPVRKVRLARMVSKKSSLDFSMLPSLFMRKR